MSKANTLASLVSTGGVLADGTIAASEVSGMPSGTVVGTTDTQTLTNKTIQTSTINSSAIGGTTAAAGSFTTLAASSTVSANGSVGSSGQVLTSAGAGSPAVWSSPSSGAVSLISAVNIAGTQVHNFTGLSGNYQYRLCVTAHCDTSVSSSTVKIQFGTGTATTNSYYYGGCTTNGTSVASDELDNGSSFEVFHNNQTLSNSYSIQMTCDIFTVSGENVTWQFRGNGYGNANNTQTSNLMGVNLALTSMSSIHLDLGNTLWTGKIYLYGIKNA